jgi:hypothetical protein
MRIVVSGDSNVRNKNLPDISGNICAENMRFALTENPACTAVRERLEPPRSIEKPGIFAM